MAGVGITVRSEFLKLFDRRIHFEVIFPGRAAVLHLAGTQGTLDIFTVYFHTGAAALAGDLLEAGFDPAGRVVSNFELRGALRHRIAHRIKPRDQVMSLISGDFNYVVHAADRICPSAASNTGGRDHRESSCWRNLIEKPFGFHELFQPEPTYASPDSRSRLDRIYSNQYDTEFMDKSFSCTALNWQPELSRHRPISFRKCVASHKKEFERPIGDQVLEHPDWPRQVALAWTSLLRDNADASAITKLQLIKRAMRHAEKALNSQLGRASPAENLDDRIGITMKFLRASEVGNPERVSRCIERYPLLRDLVANPYDFTSPVGPRLACVRRHVMELQKDFTMQELTSLHEDLKVLDPVQATRRRRKNHHLVCRLAPGRSCHNFAIDTPSGVATSDPKEMIRLLRNHWETVFRQKDIDLELLESWLRDDAHHLPANYHEHLPHTVVPRETFKEAILHTGNSSPGRDGIPFKAWRRIADLASGAFEAAYLEIIAEDGLDRTRTEWCTFNESIMVFLPKKAVFTKADGTEVFPAGNMRPLNITNTDNRILCSAVRIHVEPLVTTGVSPEQRGFLRGRSMLANVFDIEEDMMENALTQDFSLAVFLDFESAFPSLSQTFIHRVLAARDWPSWFRNFVSVLYDNNYCYLTLNGSSGEGFGISAGVRQGCPLSPLIFSIISDVLIRRVRRLLPGVTLRAYADDIALVLRHGPRECGPLEIIFSEYEFVSCLRLHRGKSIIVPLSLHSHTQVRSSVAAVAKLWGEFTVSGHAKYLGFLLGPTRELLVWDPIFKKMQERALIWQRIGGGMFCSVTAYRMHILPLAGFLIQLEDLPPQWGQVERNLMITLFPGARGWATPGLLQQLKSLGFASEVPDPVAVALGAKCRVYRWENIAHGGLHLARRARRLAQAFSSTMHLDRAVAWRSWFDKSFFSNVMRAQHRLEATAATKHLSVGLLLQGAAKDPTPKSHWQRRCSEILRLHDVAGLHHHLRKRIDRWPLRTLPGHRVRRMQVALTRLGALVPPCVWAAALKTLLDGWTTATSNNRSADCLFECKSGNDSIAHYAYCPCVTRLASTRLQLQPVPIEDRLDDFLLLHRHSDDDRLALRALCLYATFTATNAARNGLITMAADAWVQAMTEGASHAGPLSRLIRSARLTR